MKGSRGTDDINRHEESPDGAELPSEMSLDSIVWTRDRAFSPGFVAVCVYADTHLHMGSANGGRGGGTPRAAFHPFTENSRTGKSQREDRRGGAS